jgi:4-hydroxysphinganine ceramide fatty acyl 2-hydroxylase
MTPWYILPFGWAPLIIYFFCQSDLSILGTILMFAAGVLSWTLVEYIVHRFIFHGEDYWLWDNPKIMAFHFLFHGIHHAFPMDAYRLVMPVIPGHGFFTLVIVPVKLIIPAEL